MADLYVYFFEQALRLLRPGGRFALTVTNKWLKAGYAEELRGVLAERAWLVAITDFGHARGFFPGTDVFPSIVCTRRPLAAEKPPEDVAVTVVPRDLVRMEELETQVAAGRFAVIRSELTREPWVLEPSEVRALMSKLIGAGPPLRKYVGQDAPYRGVLTGLNEAFVVTTEIRDALVLADQSSAEVIRPFLRGQDIGRWASEWDSLWLIFTRRGIDIDRYPAIRNHLTVFREKLEPQPVNWQGSSWAGRKTGSYKWFEIQDNIAYHNEFERPKIIFPDIAIRSQFAFDKDGMYSTNTTYIIPIDESQKYLLPLLNSSLIEFFFKTISALLRGGYLRFINQYVTQIPIRRIMFTTSHD